MKETEKLIRKLGYAAFAFFILSFFGAMVAPYVPGDPEFWTTCILWSAIVNAVMAPGMLILHTDVGRVERSRETVFPEPEPFDRDDWEGTFDEEDWGENVFG